MRKFLGAFLPLILALSFACAKSGGKIPAAKAAGEKTVHFLIQQDRWGEIAPCG